MSSYSCRNAYGRAEGRLSEHGKVNALDIAGFVTARGQAAFDVADLYSGPLGEVGTRDATGALPLDEKLRQAYFWIVNHAIISPFYDIEYVSEPPPTFSLGERKVTLTLPTAQSYSSYVLMPLLNLAVRGRCLLVGGPGRGKTVIAWVWDVYRSARFVKNVRVITFKDVNVEELPRNEDLALPKDGYLGDLGN